MFASCHAVPREATNCFRTTFTTTPSVRIHHSVLRDATNVFKTTFTTITKREL
jgi:hypothetical protein